MVQGRGTERSWSTQVPGKNNFDKVIGDVPIDDETTSVRYVQCSMCTAVFVYKDGVSDGYHHAYITFACLHTASMHRNVNCLGVPDAGHGGQHWFITQVDGETWKDKVVNSKT